MDIFKSPIVISILGGSTTYAYLLYSYRNKIKKDPKYKNYPRMFIIPIIVSVIIYIIATYYMSNEENEQQNNNNNMNSVAEYKLIKGDNINYLTSESPKSFHLIGGGVTIPNSLPENMPDVFIETIQ